MLHFVRGLLPFTRAVVTEAVSHMLAFERCDMTVVRRLASAERTTYHTHSSAAPADAKKPAKRASSSLKLSEGSPPVNSPGTPEYAYPYVTPPSDVFPRTDDEGPRINRLHELGHTTCSE